jgi:aryl-alcohol dehydrogenase-like predicted oxidoreductase
MIDKIEFGRTGHMSTRTLFGAAALEKVTRAEADKTLELLVEYGVNHIDTAANYGDAELHIAPWLSRHRQEFFLATKTEERTYQGAKEELRRSLMRMQVESVDLWQMHALIDPDEWEIAMGPGGALDAFIEAREQGLVRFLGVTGHGVDVAEIHMRSLQRFDFDSVLLPYNFAMMKNQKYAADFHALLALCRERKVAFQTIKTITRAPWGRHREQSRACWYDPLEAQVDVDAAVFWAMDEPDIFLNTVGDIHVLPAVLNAASRFQPSSQSEWEPRLEDLSLEPLFV